jgi:hypothetical protein
MYALMVFLLRARRIRLRKEGPYDDTKGPIVLVVVLISAIVANIAISEIQANIPVIINNSVNCTWNPDMKYVAPKFMTASGPFHSWVGDSFLVPSHFRIEVFDKIGNFSLGFPVDRDACAVAGHADVTKFYYATNVENATVCSHAILSMEGLEDPCFDIPLKHRAGNKAFKITALGFDPAESLLWVAAGNLMGYSVNEEMTDLTLKKVIDREFFVNSSLAFSEVDGLQFTNSSIYVLMGSAQELVVLNRTSGRIDSRYEMPNPATWKGVYVNETATAALGSLQIMSSHNVPLFTIWKLHLNQGQNQQSCSPAPTLLV